MSKVSRWLQYRYVMAACAAALLPAIAHADPVITGFNRPSAPLNSFLTIYGSGFNDAQGQSYVLIGGRAVPVLAWSNAAITVIVNPLAFNHAPVALDTAYPVQVVTQPANKTSNAVNFTITSAAPFVNPPGAAVAAPSDQPSFERFQKTTFCDGNVIAVYGSGFGSTQGMGFVTITVPFLDSMGKPFTQEFALPVLGWSENAINVVLNLPPGARLGRYTLTVHRANGKTTSGSFTVVPCPPAK